MNRFPAPAPLAAVAVLILAAVLSVAAVSQAAQNPLLSGGGSEQDQGPQLTGYPGFLAPVMERIARFQVALKQKLVRFSRDIKDNPLGRSFWLFLGAAFAYGALHALGPGHGKVYACSYFLSRPSTLAKALWLGNLSMFAHVLSAVTLVLGGYYVLRMAGALAVENMTPILESVSYALLLIVGLYLALRIFLDLKTGRVAAMLQDVPEPNAAAGDDEEALAEAAKSCGHAHHRDLTDRRSLWATALAVGLVPCPGASIILIFAISQHLVVAGLLAMLAISLGMGATITLIAAVAVLSHRTLFALARKRQKLFVTVHALLGFTGALAILGLGGLLLLGRLI